MNGELEMKKSSYPEQSVSALRHMPWGLVALLLAYSFVSWLNRVSMSVAGTEKIIPEGVLSETQMGDIYSALVLTYTVFMLPGGWFADRAGPRLALILMGLGSAVFAAMTGVAGQFLVPTTGLYVGLLAARGLMGVFTAPIYPASAWVVSLEVPENRRAEANGLIMGAALLGIAAAPFAFGFLMDWLRWPVAFVVMGGITAALAVAWMLVTSRRSLRGLDAPTVISAGTRNQHRSPWWDLLRNRRLLFLTAAYAFIGYYENLFFFWSQYYFKDVMHYGKETSRVYSTVLYVAMALGMFTGGLLADRVSYATDSRRARLLVAVCGLLGGAAFLSVGLAVTQPHLVVASLSLALAAVGLCEGPLWAMAVESGGRRGGTAAGIFNTGGNFGGIFSPAITPRLAVAVGWTSAVAVSVGGCLVGVVFLAFASSSKPFVEYQNTE
ncbi:MAG: MFS transporter [Acidimicrobiia bacterium]|nr:MFS transporter [Acidimicrobiia bacterium]